MKRIDILVFQNEIFLWYEKNQRDLPWREVPFDTSLQQRDPYKILVSEVMLQQTQVSRVIPKYEAWIYAFPDVSSLAKASTSEVLRLWSGLGYNRRALYLQKSAQALVYLSSSRNRGSDSHFRKAPLWCENDRVEWPRTVEELKKLPGIGEYTAAAVACFAFNEQIAVVDTNVRKVILTKFSPHPNPLPQERGKSDERRRVSSSPSRERIEVRGITEEQIREIAEELLPKGKAYEWNQALMDYASAVLRKEKIPVPKQSPFKGSNRYYRGQVVKVLLEYKVVSIKYLAESLQKDCTFVERIVQDLVKDGLVKLQNKKLSFP